MSYKLNYPKGASEVFKSGLKNYIAKKVEISLSLGLESSHAEIYTLDEAKEILKNKFNEFNNKLKDILSKKPDILGDQKELLEQIKLSIEKSDFKEVNEVQNVFFELLSLDGTLVYNDTGKNPPPRDLAKCVHFECQEAIKEYLKKVNFKNMVLELKIKNKEEDKIINENTSYCKSHFLENFLKDYDAENIRKLLPAIKSSFLLNVTKNYSAHSKQAFKNYLEKNLEFITRKMKSDSSRFINKVNKGYEEFQDEIKSPIDYKNYSTKNKLSILFDYMSQENDREVDPMAKLRLCHGGFSAVAWDGFVSGTKAQATLNEYFGYSIDPNKDAILTSMYSCFHPGYGKGIIAHELGHALSHAFSNNKLSAPSYTDYLKLRKCVNKMQIDDYKTKSINEKSHKGDFLKTEEDTADLISYLTFPSKNSLYSCGLLNTSHDGTSYDELDLDFEGIENDTHSASIVRLLREAKYKGVALPSSCQKLIEQNKDKFRFETCI